MTFKKGQSGNPSGRPKGIVDKRAKLRQLIDDHGEELVERLVKIAKAGNFAALRMCIERLVPKVKQDHGITFNLPEDKIDSGENMIKIANGITEAVAAGQMTLDEAHEFRQFLRMQKHMLEDAERKLRDEEWARQLNSN